MHAEFIPLTDIALDANNQQEIAVFDRKIIDRTHFTTDIKAQMSLFSEQKSSRYALYYEEAYPFCVNLFALLHCNKDVWIAGNNKIATAERLIEQGCQLAGEWSGLDLLLPKNEGTTEKLEALNLDAELTIFTSGSNGEAKAIKKSLRQLQNEVEILEQQWGGLLGQAQVLATVSHQHIYGLLFRVLWPLASGRCFHSQMYLSPEALLKAAKNNTAVWIASPAQLKRLDEMAPWDDIAMLRVIFSSGGALLMEAATQINQCCGHKVIEVYGSSETGGVAWRQSVSDELWTVFDGITIKRDIGGGQRLFSPFLSDPAGHILDDKIEFHENGSFLLLGRIDRIVKVEEKRLSLDELEAFLNDSEWVQQSHTFLIPSDLSAKKRDKIASVLVLTNSGNEYLQQQGRAALIKQLRKRLSLGFESVVLPRKWMFIESLPLTTQGKIDHQLLMQLVSLDTTRFPQIQGCNISVDSVLLQFCVQPEIIYFSGHFPGLPILPGVAQIAWVERFGKIFFNIDQPFLRMEVIKFKKKITPGKIIQMQLNWKVNNNKLYFEFISSSDSHSSGRIVYGEQP